MFNDTDFCSCAIFGENKMPFAFDPTGFNPANKVSNEPKEVVFAGQDNPYLIIPANAPFYKEGFSIVDQNGYTLTEGVHYHFTHVWSDGVTVIGKQIFGGIALVSLTTSGVYRLNYQAVGGNYASNSGVLTEGFQTLTLPELFLLDWKNTPSTFPNMLHTHPLLTGYEGMRQIFEKFDAIVKALETNQNVIQMDDVVDLGPQFIGPTLNALNEIIAILSGSTLDMGPINALTLKMNSLIPWATVDPNLSSYDIPIAGFFKLKVGKIEFTPPTNPTSITFPAAFTERCLWAGVFVGVADPEIIQDHLVTYSTPKKQGISHLSITQVDTDYPVAPRVITYIAIGL